MGFRIYMHKDSAKVLVGMDGYKNSLIEKYNDILDYIPMNQSNYYVYSPNSKDDVSFMKYVSYYYLNTTNVLVLTDVDQLDNIVDGTLILLEDETKEKLEKKGWSNFNKYVYHKEN